MYILIFFFRKKFCLCLPHFLFFLIFFLSFSNHVSRPPAEDGPLNDHIALKEWVLQHGGHLDDRVQLARHESRGVHIQVKPDCASAGGVPPGTCVIRTPLALTMSYFDAIDFRPSAGAGAGAGSDSSLPF